MNLKEQLQQKIDLKTKPTGALGKLEEIALQAGLIQNTLSPSVNNPVILVFAADHGITEEKVSPYPKEVTYQMVLNFVSGGAAINVFCRQNNINLKVVDAGVDFDFDDKLNVINAKIARGTNNMIKSPAMTVEQCNEAIAKGVELVKHEAATGCNIIGFGEMGIGNTSSSSLLMSKFTGLSLEECTGAGAGMTGEKLFYKLKVLKQVSEKYNPSTKEETLAVFGGFEIAMMTGAFLEAYKQKMIILVDGFIASTALLCAKQFDPGITGNCIFCHASQEKGHKLLLEHLQAEPVLNLGMRLGEGTGAAVALPIIKSAIAFLNEMSSFADANVSNKD